MRAPYLKLHLHLVWATWDRLPFIDAALEPELYRVLGGKARELGCQTLAIGGDFDHVHCLIRFSATVTIAQLAGEMKGASSHWVNHVGRPGMRFKWQGAYGAFCVSESGLPDVEHYIRHQKEHHAHKQLWKDWEECFLRDELMQMS